MVKLSFIPFISIAGRTFSKEEIKKYHADLFGDAFIQETFEV